MVKTNKKKYVLSLVIILALLIVIALPVLLQNTPTAFPPQPNTLANTPTLNQITSKANPQPVNLWWNYSWNYRMEVNVTEQGYADRINEIANVSLTFTDGHCANNSIRVLYYNAYTEQWIEVPIQIVKQDYYGGTRVQSCDLLFLCNVTKNGISTYYVYYNDSYNIPIKTYTTPLNITIDPTGIRYFLFNTGVISGNYTIRYSYTRDPDTGLYFDDDACFRIFRVNGVNIIPTTGLHSGIDRIDADDLQRWYETPYNVLNWTAQLLENGPLRATVRVYKTSLDKFTTGSGVSNTYYGWMNKTYTFYAYQGYVKANVTCVNNSVPIYDFAVANITDQWNLYIDTYNLGVATGRPWTDKISSPQPFNHMSLVRNDGLGLALIGSPMWPEDVFGQRTSVEFGYGDIELHNAPGYGTTTKSFLIRNDGRPDAPDVEFRIKIPFIYYITGITQGFNQTINTWYQVNNPTQANNGSETNKFYPLIVNVTDAFGNPISGANVTIYNDEPPATQNQTPGITNSQGLVTFLPNKNYTIYQYWIQANKTTPYWNYTSNAIYWYPKEAPPHPETINIQMNITTVYAEVWDNNTHRVQNANVTLNYENASLTDISQNVDLFYANCSFYAWANVNLTIDIYINATLETGITVYIYGTNTSVTQPININEPKAFRVELGRDIYAVSTTLTYLGGIINEHWKDNVSFYVWFNASGGGSIDNADWVNYTIYDSGVSVYNGTMTYVSGQPLGNYNATFNTSLVGLFGGKDYTITVTAKPHDSNQLYPLPINLFLSVKNLLVEVFSEYSLDNPLVRTWTEYLHLSTQITVRLTDIINNQRLDNANVTYTITGTTHVNENMISAGVPGWYKVDDSVVDNLTTGNFTVIIVSSLQNYTINDYYIKLTINLAPSSILAPSKIQGFFDQNISVQVRFVRADNGNPILGASVSWIIQGTNITGNLTDPLNTGNYAGQIPNGTLTSGSYGLTIQASKENYLTKFEYINLEVLGASTSVGFTFLIPQLFGGPSDYLFVGPLVQVENSWSVVPVIFTYTDSNGNPVPNATITVTGGLPVFGIGGGTKGVGGSQVRALQLGAGTYLVLVPISGLPPSTLMLNIVAQAPNYQPQQIPRVITIKEKAIALAPGVRIPVSTFLLTVAALAIPTGLFLTYSFVKRARIPAIIKRIDELIRAISRGEKVTVKLIPREKVIGDILREELAIVGVEPRVEKYIPVELADLIVPLLVESGMKQKEAYAMALELKTAAPAKREKLLESVGIPGESSARIIQTIEEYEEKQAQVPIRKPRGREPIEEPTKEEAEEYEEEPEEIEVELESALPKLDVDTVEGVGDKTASKLRTADINTVEDLANCDPQEVSETTEIPVHKVQEYKNKAMSLLKLKLDDEVIDTLAKQGYSIQKAIEEAPSVLEKVTGYGKERIRKFLEDFSKLSMLVAADTSRKKLISLLRKPKIKIKKAKPTKEEPEKGED